MPTKIIGTAPYQVPRNSDLGTLAVQDLDNVNIQGGSVTLSSSSTQGYFQNTDVSEVKPSLMLDFANAKVLDPRFTFGRGSYARYYDGRTFVKCEENLLPYSQSSSGSSGEGRLYTTDNAAPAPDGTMTAVDVQISTSNSRHYFCTSRTDEPSAPAGTTFTASAYVKSRTATHVAVLVSDNAVGGGARYGITVNLSDGAVGGFSPSTGCSGTSYTVTSIANGWWRVTLTMTSSAASPGSGANINFTPLPNNGSGYTNVDQYPSWTGNGTDSIYVWGWQLEKRSGASAYTPTNGAAVTKYTYALLNAVSNTPRFDHDPITGESKGLLIENQATNVLPYSSSFENWIKEDASIRTNVAIAPDGTLTADQLVANTNNIDHSLYQSIGAGTYVFSVYLKADEFKYALIGYNNADNAGAFIDLTTGAVTKNISGNSVISSTPVGNGWFRVAYTYTNGGTTYPMICTSADGQTITHKGTGFGGIFVWGAQLESGSVLTSYVATGSSTATRSSDNVYVTGDNFNNFYNQTEGTIFYEMNSARADTNTFAYSLDNGTSTSGANVMFGSPGASRGFYVANGSAIQTNMTISSVGTNVFSKVAAAYKVNDFAVCLNGATPVTDNAGTVPCNISRLILGTAYDWATANYIVGCIKKFAYYPKRLSNAELQEITL